MSNPTLTKIRALNFRALTCSKIPSLGESSLPACRGRYFTGDPSPGMFEHQGLDFSSFCVGDWECQLRGGDLGTKAGSTLCKLTRNKDGLIATAPSDVPGESLACVGGTTAFPLPQIF